MNDDEKFDWIDIWNRWIDFCKKPMAYDLARTKTENEIAEGVFNDIITERWVKPGWLQYKDEIMIYIQTILNHGIKAGRKHLAEEQERRCEMCNQPTLCIVKCCCNCNFPGHEKLQKEREVNEK